MVVVTGWIQRITLLMVANFIRLVGCLHEEGQTAGHLGIGRTQLFCHFNETLTEASSLVDYSLAHESDFPPLLVVAMLRKSTKDHK